MSCKVFFKLLNEFLDCVIEARPDNKGAVDAKANLSIIPESMHYMVVDNWFAWSSPVVEAVRQKDGEVVGNALDNCGVALIAQIGAREILCDPDLDAETRESFWRFLTSLTALAGMIKKGTTGALSEAVETPVPVPVEVPPVAPSPPKGADVVQGIAKAIPEIFKGLNDILKNQSDDNPLGQIMRQMLNPDQVQTGTFNNVAANLMQRTDPSVIGSVSAQTGLGTDEIMRKLERLEMLERARQKRKTSRG
jgi:hypothetical protein